MTSDERHLYEMRVMLLAAKIILHPSLYHCGYWVFKPNFTT